MLYWQRCRQKQPDRTNPNASRLRRCDSIVERQTRQCNTPLRRWLRTDSVNWTVFFFFQQKLLVISAYLPTRSNRESDVEFHDCVDQLNEICQKFNHTHDTVIGRDLNEDLSKCDSKNNRITYLREFLNENNITYSCTGKTFVKSNGVECSEIDYFLHRINGVKVIVDKRIINTDCNVSDYYPIQIQVEGDCNFQSNSKVTTSSKVSNNVNWRKVPKDVYKQTVEQKLCQLDPKECTGSNQADNAISTLTSILKNAADESARNCTKWNSKPKLKVWTPEISKNLRLLREATKLWSSNGKSNDPTDHFVIQKKECKKQFRKSYRIELAKRQSEGKFKIISTRTRDSRLFISWWISKEGAEEIVSRTYKWGKPVSVVWARSYKALGNISSR